MASLSRAHGTVGDKGFYDFASDWEDRNKAVLSPRDWLLAHAAYEAGKTSVAAILSVGTREFSEKWKDILRGDDYSDLLVRAYNVLDSLERECGCTTVGDLLALRKIDFLRRKNCGKKTICEIMKWLSILTSAAKSRATTT